MPLSKEELLMPRKIVMIDYPGTDYTVGQIIHFNNKCDAYTGTMEWESESIKSVNGGRSRRCILFFEPYPLVFQDLPWYAERSVEDMPEYVRYGDYNSAHAIYRIIEYNPQGYESFYKNGGLCAISENSTVKDYLLPTFYNSFPADETNYTNYINNLKK